MYEFYGSSITVLCINATFSVVWLMCVDMRLMPGDELRLRSHGLDGKTKWEAVGQVIKIPNSILTFALCT